MLRVLHPAREDDPGHAIWKRDFTGASGLFSIVLKPAPQQAVDAFLDTVKLFGMGYSWGGYESLGDPVRLHVVSHGDEGGIPAARPCAYISVLSIVEDLKADLASGFAAFNADRRKMILFRRGSCRGLSRST